jgi:hypothetical protein
MGELRRGGRARSPIASRAMVADMENPGERQKGRSGRQGAGVERKSVKIMISWSPRVDARTATSDSVQFLRGRIPARRKAPMETIKTVLFLLVAAALAGAGMLVVIGGGDGEVTHEGILRIAHPYPSTFDVMSDPKKRMYWVPGITSSVKEGAGEMDVGSRIREVLEIDGVRTERVFEVKVYIPGKKLSLATTGVLCDYEVTYSFGSHQTGRKTKLSYTLRAQYHERFDKLIEPIRAADLRKRVRGEVDALKLVLETTNEFR